MGKHILIKEVENGYAVDVDYLTKAVFENFSNVYCPYEGQKKVAAFVLETLIGHKSGSIIEENGKQYEIQFFLSAYKTEVKEPAPTPTNNLESPVDSTI